jgi:PTS system mannose-specific IIA component
MIGIVVVTHGNIGCEMVNAVRRIIPDVNHICAVAVESDDPQESIRLQVADAISNVDTGSGVLILTDMFGGTPSNICLSFLKPSKVEVVSGLNLPMLIKLANIRNNVNFDETVDFIQQYGKKNIVIASHVLARKADCSD